LGFHRLAQMHPKSVHYPVDVRPNPENGLWIKINESICGQ